MICRRKEREPTCFRRGRELTRLIIPPPRNMRGSTRDSVISVVEYRQEKRSRNGSFASITQHSPGTRTTLPLCNATRVPSVQSEITSPPILHHISNVTQSMLEILLIVIRLSKIIQSTPRNSTYNNEQKT